MDALILVLVYLLRFHIYWLVGTLGGIITGVASAIGVPIGRIFGQGARPFLWLSGLPLTVVYKMIELMLTVIGWMGQWLEWPLYICTALPSRPVALYSPCDA